jgi:hypothetical protein
MLGLAHGIEPLGPVGREGRRADLRIRQRLCGDLPLAKKLGFGDEMFKNYEMVQGKFGMEPTPESVLREINRGGWSTGYTGQSRSG